MHLSAVFISLPLLSHGFLIPSQDVIQALRPFLGHHGHDRKQQQTVGVGFELSMSYGTAAISFPNGTTMAITTIPADEEYMSDMDDYADKDQLMPAPCYDCDDFERRPSRRPGHSDSLARMIRALKMETERHLGHRITAATACAPFLETLFRDDMLEAFELAGLRYMYEGEHSGTRDMLYCAPAALAAHDIGICDDYEDQRECERDERDMRETHVAYVHYTRSWLLVSDPTVTDVYNMTDSAERWSAEWELGMDQMHKTPGDEEMYWAGVYNLLRSKAFEKRNHRHHDSGREHLFRDVVLTGESASNPTFRKVLDVVMGDVFQHQKHMPRVYGDDPLFIAAIGAAEIAKRALFDKENNDRGH